MSRGFQDFPCNHMSAVPQIVRKRSKIGIDCFVLSDKNMQSATQCYINKLNVENRVLSALLVLVHRHQKTE